MLKTGETGSMVIIDNEHSLDFSNIKELGYDTIEINIDNKKEDIITDDTKILQRHR